MIFHMSALILCMLCIFLSSADFFKIKLFFFFLLNFRNTIRMSNGSHPDQDRHCVGPDLGLNCLQSLSADDNSRCWQRKS